MQGNDYLWGEERWLNQEVLRWQLLGSRPRPVSWPGGEYKAGHFTLVSAHAQVYTQTTPAQFLADNR